MSFSELIYIEENGNGINSKWLITFILKIRDGWLIKH